MKMSLSYARALLSVTAQDDLASLKKKYHRLMSTCHPDAVGSDRPEHIKKAQEINEAYRLLKEEKTAFFEDAAGYQTEDAAEYRTGYEKKTPVWTGKKNEAAFRERNIYLYYSLEVDEIQPYYQAARGKYFWDPAEEEFPLFLISIHKLIKEITDDAPDLELSVKSRLFHYLAEQFIEPVEVLQKIAVPEKTDRAGRSIYHFRAYLNTAGRKTLPEGTVLYPKAFRENQIIVRDLKGTEYGALSFDDDRLYFCMIPLLKQKLAKIKMEVQNGKVDFYFRLEKEAEQYNIPNRNLEIASLLTRL